MCRSFDPQGTAAAHTGIRARRRSRPPLVYCRDLGELDCRYHWDHEKPPHGSVRSVTRSEGTGHRGVQRAGVLVRQLSTASRSFSTICSYRRTLNLPILSVLGTVPTPCQARARPRREWGTPVRPEAGELPRHCEERGLCAPSTPPGLAYEISRGSKMGSEELTVHPSDIETQRNSEDHRPSDDIRTHRQTTLVESDVATHEGRAAR